MAARRRAVRRRPTIEVRWAAGMAPLRPSDAPAGVPWSGVGSWRCPVCDRHVPRRPGPGRQRVYCSNGCRQFAYRWRRDHLGADQDERPVERASTRSLHHAVRRSDDPVGDRLRGDRRVTVCGAFARRASDTPAAPGHVRLRPVSDRPGPRRVCERCVHLAQLPDYDESAAMQAAAVHRAVHDASRLAAAARRRRSRRVAELSPEPDPPRPVSAPPRPGSTVRTWQSETN